MNDFLSHIQIKVNSEIYLKDPDSSELGKKIISNSIEMIDEVGIECFTFKKLASRIASTEASIYRYFENKHKLLLYLTAWYWNWLEYRLVFSLANIQSPEDRLKKAIRLLTEEIKEDHDYHHINEIKLSKVVITDSSKAYMHKSVDDENKLGVFKGYKNLVQRVSDVIKELSPNYKYPQMLVSTIIEGAHHQRFFADHLPNLTNTFNNEDAICNFYEEMTLRSLKNHNN